MRAWLVLALMAGAYFWFNGDEPEAAPAAARAAKAAKGPLPSEVFCNRARQAAYSMAADRQFGRLEQPGTYLYAEVEGLDTLQVAKLNTLLLSLHDSVRDQRRYEGTTEQVTAASGFSSGVARICEDTAFSLLYG